MIKYIIIILFLLLIISECIGDVCFHHSIHKNKNNKAYLWVGLSLYVVMGYLYYEILKNYDNLAIPNALYQCFSVLAVTFVSVVILKEKVTKLKILGIVVILLGLSMLHV